MELMIPRELPAGIQQEIVSPGDDESNWENTPQSILQSMLGSLNDGRFLKLLRSLIGRTITPKSREGELVWLDISPSGSSTERLAFQLHIQNRSGE